MGNEELMEGWFRCPEYTEAIHLALNAAAGGLEVHDFLYYIETDCFYVELSDSTYYYGGTYYDMGFVLHGDFVRRCFKAAQEGVKSWVKT